MLVEPIQTRTADIWPVLKQFSVRGKEILSIEAIRNKVSSFLDRKYLALKIYHITKWHLE